MALIYILENKINGKMYVGQTIELKNRMWAHSRPSRIKTVIDRASTKYGWNNFKQRIFYVPESLLDYFEIELIKRLNTLVPNGYNVESGGHFNNSWNRGLTKETDERLKKVGEKISIVLTGRKRGAHTEEGRRNISEAKKGKKIRPCSEERRKKASEANKGKHDHRGEKNPNFGNTGENNPMYGRAGENHPNWKGDKAKPESIRLRQYRLAAKRLSA